jgi:Tfp pilus assembly protein PilF
MMLSSVNSPSSAPFLPLSFVSQAAYEAMEQAVDFYNEGNDCLGIEEKLEEIIGLYDKAIGLNPGFALAWNNKGYVLNQIGQYEETLKSLNQAIQIDGTLVIAFNNRGNALQGLGECEEAIRSYGESIKREPENYSAWWGVGVCLYDLQQFEKVIEIADKLIDLNSENFSGWYMKASCQSQMGHNQQALENLKESAKLNSEVTQQLAKNNSDFDELRKDDQFKALMESSVDVSYENLKQHLREKAWIKADKETTRLMKMVIKKIADHTELNSDTLSLFPCVDLNTVDTLWRESSGDQFGFSIQKEIYQSTSKDRDAFGNEIGWRVKDTDGNYSWRSNANFNYSSSTAPKGHLPSSLWAGEDGWFENRRDRLTALFARMDSCSIRKDSKP